jgi:predicted CXXCH cytochrome family protein
MTSFLRFARVASLAIALLGGLGVRTASAQTAQAAASGCVSCHVSLPDGRLSTPPKAFQGDVHQTHGFSCVDCHGGDATAAEKPAAHNAAKGYRGKPSGKDIITVCARCHSDAEFMHKFAPRQRVDQAAEYATSVHGKRLATGDTQVATCISCHGAHGVRLVNDAKSPAFPTNVAATCGACHASTEHMKGYTQPDGKPLPTNQLADYQRSVHYAALTKSNDLSAPTCNDCHGNHGAAPPGVSSLTTVCGTCHAVFAAKFAPSVHAQIFERACIECHSNHAVLQPSDDMLGTSSQTVCASCHSEKDDPGYVAAAKMRASLDGFKHGIETSTDLIGRVKNAGMEVGDDELALNQARTTLVLARTEMHAFDPASLDRVVADGTKILAGVDQAGNHALVELSYRRRGLFVSLAAILLVVIALAFKIKGLKEAKT